MDGDTVWLHPVPSLRALRPPALGHFFGAMQASPFSPGKTGAEVAQRWALRFLKRQGDFALIATPCRFPCRSRVLSSWIDKLETEYRRGVKVDYHFPLAALHECVKEWGLTEAVAEVFQTSPISRFLKATVPSRSWDESILDDALCANNFWQSAKTLETGGSPQDRGRSSRIQPGSPWAVVLCRADVAIAAFDGVLAVVG